MCRDYVFVWSSFNSCTLKENKNSEEFFLNQKMYTKCLIKEESEGCSN